MATQDWVSASQTATGPDGQKMALVSGQWQPATQTATGPNGQKMALIGGSDTPPSTQEPSSPQQPAASGKAQVVDYLHNLRANTENTLKPLQPAGLSETAPKPTLGSAAHDIGVSTALGSAIGALSPEIVKGLGVAAMALPVVGEVVGPGLIAAGTAMSAGRLAAAASGGLSGLASESAGQAIQAAGGTRGEAEAARMVGGLGSGAAADATAAISHLIPSPLKTLWGAVSKFSGVTTDSSAAVKAAKGVLSGLEEQGQPQTAVHAMLQQTVEANRLASEKVADGIVKKGFEDAARMAQTDADAAARHMDAAHARAEQIRSDAVKLGDTLDKASGGKLATANRVLAMAKPELDKVGPQAELSDIGNALRKGAEAQESGLMAARKAEYQQTEARRDAAVQAKESAGESVDSMPAMQSLKKQLTTKLGIDAKGFAQTTEPGVRAGYQRVLDAINPPEGIKTSFEALDHVRRRLGDVVAGRDVEGYQAIGQANARKMYAQIAKIQEDFAGKDQKVLQQGYADATKGLEEFGSKTGKRLTSLDKLGIEHTTDPKDLPARIFSSQDRVRAARSLMKNGALLDGQAQSYVARSLQGKSQQQVQDWMRANGDWMREIPGLQQRTAAYANKLAQIQRTADKLTVRGKAAGKAAVDARAQGVAGAESERQAGVDFARKAAEGSQEAQQRVVEGAAKGAEEAKASSFAPAKGLDTILKSGEAPEAVRALLLNGKPEQTRLAAAGLANQPGGREMLDKSVRQILGGMTEGNLKNQWYDRIRPMLKSGKMLTPEAMATLEKDVARVMSAYGGKDRTAMVRRYVASALGAVPSMAGGLMGQ